MAQRPVDLIVRRLRQHAMPDPHDEREVLHSPLLNEAADEIERLREVIRTLVDRKITYSGSDLIIPFANQRLAIRCISEARSILTPNASGKPTTEAAKPL